MNVHCWMLYVNECQYWMFEFRWQSKKLYHHNAFSKSIFFILAVLNQFLFFIYLDNNYFALWFMLILLLFSICVCTPVQLCVHWCSWTIISFNWVSSICMTSMLLLGKWDSLVKCIFHSFKLLLYMPYERCMIYLGKILVLLISSFWLHVTHCTFVISKFLLSLVICA